MRTPLLVLTLCLLAPPRLARGDDVKIPAGCFRMGCTKAPCAGEPLPSREVCLDEYSIGHHEVTVAEYKACVDAGTCTKPQIRGACNWEQAGRDDHPVNCLSWQQASAYCAWAGKRLPTEAEWERAARGTASRLYPWGDEPPSCERGVIGQCSHKGTERVSGMPAGDTPEGVSDLAGNVFEYVNDWFAQVKRWQQDETKVHDPRGPCDGAASCRGHKYKVIKGGSYDSVRSMTLAWARYFVAPNQDRLAFIGFRCVVPGP